MSAVDLLADMGADKEDEMNGEGFAFFCWHCLKWPLFTEVTPLTKHQGCLSEWEWDRR